MTTASKRISKRRPARSRRDRLRILFTCVGRRVELVDSFRRAADALGVDLTIYGADLNWIAPAMHRVDKPLIVPPIGNRQHLPQLLRIVRREKINLVIPLIDSDLLTLGAAAGRFADAGCTLLISDEKVIRICSDKMLTYKALRKAGVDTPETWTATEALAKKKPRFPLFLKPRYGSAGQGLFRIDNSDELRVFIRRNRKCVVQQFVEGSEYTLDVYTGLDGKPRCVVPRKRLEVRTGEVSKGMIVKDPRIIEVGRSVIAALGRCRGVVTVQCMLTPNGRIRVIEINPRFGGGAPLSIHAGADFPKWIMAEVLHRKLRIHYQGYKDRLTMLRFDDSVFVNGKVVPANVNRMVSDHASHRA